MCRNSAGIILYAYLPVFFVTNFPHRINQFSALNAIALSVCGLVASIFEGIISDRYERKTYWAKPIINMVQVSFAMLFIAFGTFYTSNFYLSLACYALKVLFAGSNSGPSITMLQNTVGRQLQGSVISTYFFCITMAQTITPWLFQICAGQLGAFTNPKIYGKLIGIFVTISCSMALPFYYRAGKSYVKHMEKQFIESILEKERRG